MKTTTIRLYSLDYSNVKTYFAAALFILGNLVLPQLCHLIPQGGLTLLPIYFFTLIAAYKYGWKVGLLTAVFSPVLNHLLFGMPLAGVLPAILLKSVLLAVVAGYAANRFKRISIPVDRHPDVPHLQRGPGPAGRLYPQPTPGGDHPAGPGERCAEGRHPGLYPHPRHPGREPECHPGQV